MATKKRSIPIAGAVPAKWTYWDSVFGGPKTKSTGSSPPYPLEPLGSQVTESESHPGWNRRKPGAQPGDIGGPFSSTKRSCTVIGGRVPQFSESGVIGGFLDRTIQYEGYCLPYVLPMAWPPDVSSSESSLNAFGTKAVANCKPTNALVDLATTLAELIENQPRAITADLWKQGTERARKAGSEYLNVEFGWRPLVNDIYQTIDAMQRADAVIKQYLRDAGRPVRRRFDFPVQHSTDIQVVLSGVSAKCAYTGDVLLKSPANAGQVIRTRDTRVKRWFSGAFTYHLPFNVAGEVDLSLLKAKNAYGLDITPETLWNLAPWSWAVDWFAPVGDLIGNLQDWAGDGLVLTYGYIMEHSLVRDTYSFSGPTGLHRNLIPGLIVMTTEVKRRVPATPFGFGLTWNGFSPRQQAIIAALGLSRGRR